MGTGKFTSEVKLSSLSAATSLDVDSAFDPHNSTLSGILDKMIPFEDVRVHEKPALQLRIFKFNRIILSIFKDLLNKSFLSS